MTVPPTPPPFKRPPESWVRAETARILASLRRPYGGDCPDCSALDGQPCDATCLRYREDPGE